MRIDIAKQSISYIRHHGAKMLVPLVDESWVKQIIIWIGGITGYLLGRDNESILWVLLLLIVIDWLTGILAAMKRKASVRSRRMASSVYKIVIYFSLIITAKLCGGALGFDKIEKLVIAFYIAIEAYSIIENAEKLGVPVPEMFRKAIKGRMEESKREDQT
jgi:toxin secretion/phage lysis holin